VFEQCQDIIFKVMTEEFSESAVRTLVNRDATLKLTMRLVILVELVEIPTYG
jgi:hypothetical protein